VRIDSAGFPFVALAAAPALASALWAPSLWTLVLLLLPLAVALFFRDPERTAPAGDRLVLAPADGTVMFAGEARLDEAPPGAWRQVSIFLSLLDVHINRTPVGGRVTRVDYHPGTFRPAYRHDAHRNERSEIWLDAGGVPVVVRQIVGLLARRVVCRVKAGATVAAGDRIGLMKFGSRMDVFVPIDATLTVATGDKVTAGETVIARLAATA
jgi:phosphatidylserine decarboxylase